MKNDLKIVFVTYDREVEHWKEPDSVHTIEVDDRCVMEQMEGMEPEDRYFSRDLGSPHDCEGLLLTLIEAMKDGRAVSITYETRDRDEL